MECLGEKKACILLYLTKIRCLAQGPSISYLTLKEMMTDNLAFDLKHDGKVNSHYLFQSKEQKFLRDRKSKSKMAHENISSEQVCTKS